MTEKQSRAPLSIRCPSTGQLLETGISTDADSLAKKWHSEIRITCKCCGDTHEFPLRDLFLAQAVSAFALNDLAEREPA
jgi:RNase P subunit RPR2